HGARERAGAGVYRSLPGRAPRPGRAPLRRPAVIGRSRAAAWIAVALSAIASLAAAEAPPEVALEVPDCFGVKGEEVEKLVALELEPRMRVVGAGTPRALVGRVLCPGGGARVEL